MNAWLHQHRAALRLALRRLLGAPINTLLSLLAIGTALALPLAGVMVFANAQQLVRNTSTLPQISIFMRLDAAKTTVEKVDAQLHENPAVESVEFIARETTLAKMRETEGMSSVLSVLPRNPFPDTFVVNPVDTGAESMEALADQFRTLPQIEHVQIDSAWVRRLGALLRLARTALGMLSLLFGIGLIAITFNTIRLQVLTLKNEIAVSQLLGATDAFIRRPFFYYGTLQGALGGGVAWLLVALATQVLRTPLTELASLYDLDIAIATPSLPITACLLVAAAGLGWLGSALSLGQYLRRPAVQ